MRALTLTGPGHVHWAEVADPSEPRPEAALVRPLVAATCDFDHALVSGRVPLELPVALGHEAVGVVVEVGGEVASVAPGDRVIIPFQISCGRCSRCALGLTSSCKAVGWLSAFGLGRAAGDYGGLLSDLVTVPFADAMLVRLPDDVDPLVAASLGCNIVDAYRGVIPQLHRHPGGSVLIFAGAFDNIALYAAKLAEAAGAAEVVLVARDPAVQRRAIRAGVPFVVEWTRDLGRFDITFDASMDGQLLLSAVEATASGGVLTISTMYLDQALEWPLMAMFEKCLTVISGQPHARALMGGALAMLQDGLDLNGVMDGQVEWHDAPLAFGKGSGKWVVSRL